MKSWMMAFAGGVILLYWHGQLLPVWCWLLVPLPLVLAPLPAKVRWAFSGLVLGAAWANQQAHESLGARLPMASEGRDFLVTGFVCSVPGVDSQSVRFDFCLLYPSESLPAGARLRLHQYRSPASDAPLMVAAQASLRVTLKRPRGLANPFAPNADRQFYRGGIAAQGSVKSSTAIDQGARNECRLYCRYWAWRLAFLSRLFEQTRYWQEGAIIHALISGDRSQLDEEDWELFSATGTLHLMAISGMHVGLMALLGWWGGRAGSALIVAGAGLASLQSGAISRAMTLLPALGALLFAGGYALLAGLPVSTQRAWIMVSVFVLCRLWRVRQAPQASWVIALFLVLMVDPASVLDYGFWLSFGAVAVLIAGFAWRQGSINKFSALLLAQWFIFVGLMPALLFLGLPVSVTGLVANLVAIPLVTSVTVPLAVIGWGAGSLHETLRTIAFEIANDSLIVLRHWLTCFDVDLALWYGTSPNADGTAVWLLALCVFLGLGVLISARMTLFSLLGCLWIALVFGSYQAEPEPPVEVVVFDVGQGLAVAMRAGRRVMFYDLGYGNEEYAVFKSAVMPWYRVRGKPVTELVVISHGDADHGGGLAYVLENLAPSVVQSGEPERLGVKVQIEACRPGVIWHARQGGLEASATVIAADAGNLLANDRSCVVLLQVNDWSMLITGDLSIAGELKLLTDPAIQVAPVNVLIAGHHGSQTATSSALLNRTRPDQVVYSAGYLNRFGHPHQKVRARVSASGAVQLNTADKGAVFFVWNEQGVLLTPVQTSRNPVMPFWANPGVEPASLP